MCAHFRHLLALLTVGCLLFCAPGYGTVERAGKGDPAVQTRFTAADARQALIEMVQGRWSEEDDQLLYGLADLRAGGGMVLMDDKTEGILCETWSCHLARKAFVLGFTPIGAGCRYSCTGVFERTGGKWVARITGENLVLPRRR
jgi:hypothetical protein